MIAEIFASTVILILGWMLGMVTAYSILRDHPELFFQVENVLRGKAR
jgi:hypothetical protein